MVKVKSKKRKDVLHIELEKLPSQERKNFSGKYSYFIGLLFGRLSRLFRLSRTSNFN